MNMHGIMVPAGASDEPRVETRVEAARGWLMRHRGLMLVVVLPSLLIGLYLMLFASNQYESEAHYIVRSTGSPQPAGLGVSTALSMVTGASAAQNEAMGVADYLTSHDAVDTLRRDDKLVERFNRSDIDMLSRLNKANPTPEQLLKYYRSQVRVNYSSETGITVIRAATFRPEDSYQLIGKLLQLGEQRVNALNRRSYTDSIATARRQLADAETALAQVQGQLTAFRQNRRDIDPQATGQAQLTLVSSLTQQLSLARAQMNAMSQSISRSSPQYQALANRVSALEGQIAAQSGRLVGGRGAIASDISGYEQLQLRQGFLSKRYEAAAASLDRAREQALRQQLYLVRVVEPNMPVKALYPQTLRIMAIVVIGLLLVYSIGWLILVGVREHAA